MREQRDTSSVLDARTPQRTMCSRLMHCRRARMTIGRKGEPDLTVFASAETRKGTLTKTALAVAVTPKTLKSWKARVQARSRPYMPCNLTLSAHRSDSQPDDCDPRVFGRGNGKYWSTGRSHPGRNTSILPMAVSTGMSSER